MNANQSIIQAVRRSWTLTMRRLSIAKHRVREQDERVRAELELMLDDLKAEGLDPSTHLGQEALAQMIAKRLTPKGEQWPPCDEEGFPL